MAELKCIYGQDKTEGLVLIFVHGLGGDLYKTWMSNSKDEATFWLDWVAEECDCPTWTLNYDASLSAWKDNAMPLPDQGDSVLDCLVSEPKLNNRPLLLIGHSLGGLVIKTAIISGLTKGIERYRKLIECVRGVVFIATPHKGSELADLVQAVKFLFRTNEQVGDLTLHNPYLRNLHQQFLARYNDSPFPVRTFAERKPVSLGKGFFGKIITKMVVDSDSAEPHVPNEIATPLSEDHFSICKPKNREAQIHKSLIAFIREVINDREKSAPPSPSIPEVTPTIFNVPVPRNPFFTGRSDILAKLHEALQNENEIAIKPSDKATALSGLGGVGKTQTVAEYAYRYQDEYSAVLWVLADGKDLLRSSFAQLSVLLGFKAEKQDDQILAVQSWLRNNNGWLLIFDNAETLELLTAAQELLPTNEKGHMLFTTRAQAVGRLALVSVDCFDDDTGAVFLLRRSNPKQLRDLATVEAIKPCVEESDWRTAIELVHELGGLALAIDQAGAYIEQTECCLEGYLSRYRNNAALMLNERGGYVHSKDHPEAVYKTFLLAAENAKSRSELAYEILLDSALLHPDGISEKLYADCNPLDLDKALAALKDYSLIQRVQVEDRKFFTVHRLVQVVIRDVCDG
jgi:predicted alpha/beta hydrolase family esterase